MTKAVVAKVDLGFTVIEGLQLPDGSYAIGVGQAGRLLSVSPNNAPKTFKPLLGEGFEFLHCKSELNNRDVNILSLEQFMVVLMSFAFKGNKEAQALLLASATETF